MTKPFMIIIKNRTYKIILLYRYIDGRMVTTFMVFTVMRFLLP